MPEILERLKERRIVQWAVAYLAAAWLILQVVDVLREPWGLSERWIQVGHLALAAGFLVALVLAWYHGEKGRQRISGPELAIVTALLFLIGLVLTQFASDPGASTASLVGGDDGNQIDAPTRLGIAVLPFTTASGTPEDESFAGGIHDEVLTQLGKIGSLAVKGRTSVMQYADSPENIRAIGMALGADFVVEGSVTRSDDAVRITLRLIDATTDERVWSESFNRSLTVSNLLDVQREIALNVASQVGAEISLAERELLQVEAPGNLEAYQFYLDGLSGLRAVTRSAEYEAAAQGVRDFEASIQLDSTWAPSWAALGRLKHFMASVGISPESNYPGSLVALDQALRLDSLNAPAWSSLAFVRNRWLLDFEGTEEARARAEALGGRWDWQEAIFYTSTARFEEAVAAYGRAVETDPLSLGIRNQAGRALMCLGRFEEAEAWWDRHRVRPHIGTAYVYAHTDRVPEALALLERVSDGPGFDALIYALADSTARAEALLAGISANPEPAVGSRYISAAAAAVVLGQPERALDLLEQGVRENRRGLIEARCYPEIRSLQGRPRYEAFEEAMGFPPNE